MMDTQRIETYPQSVSLKCKYLTNNGDLSFKILLKSYIATMATYLTADW